MENKEKKNNNVWIYTLLVIIILGLAGYIFYDKFWPGLVNNTDKKEVNAEVNNDENKISGKELSFDSDLVKDAKRLVPQDICGNVDYRFDGKNRKVSELTDEEKLYMLMNYLGKDISIEYDDNGDIVPVVVEESVVKKYFDDISFLNIVKRKTIEHTPYIFSYENGKYKLSVMITGCEGPEVHTGNMLELEKAMSFGDKLVLTYNYYYGDTKENSNNNSGFDYYFYKHKNDTEYIAKNPEYNETSDSYKVDWSKFDKYEFVYDIGDGDLKIQEINYIAAK